MIFSILEHVQYLIGRRYSSLMVLLGFLNAVANTSSPSLYRIRAIRTVVTKVSSMLRTFFSNGRFRAHACDTSFNAPTCSTS